MENFLTLHSLTDQISKYGEKPAVIALQKEGAACWSCARLTDHIDRLAQGLASTGVSHGDFVAILATNRPEWIVAALAVLRMGAVIVPLDVQLSDDILRHVLKDSGALFVFTSADQVDRLMSIQAGKPAGLILLDSGPTDALGWQRWLSTEINDLSPVRPSDPAVLFYTSGTTGPPKGVPLSHANLVFQIDTMLATDIVAKSTGIMLPLPLHHVFPFILGMLVPLAKGMPIVFPYSLTGQQIVRALGEKHVTTVIGVPRLYSALYAGIESQVTAAGWVADMGFKTAVNLCSWLRRRLGVHLGKWIFQPLRNNINPKLNIFASGGAKLDSALGWKLEGLGWRVVSGYGLSETAPVVSLNTLSRARIGSAGKPIPGVDIRIDPSAQPGSPKATKPTLTAEPYIQGEIVVRGPNVFSGYRNLPAETDKSFFDGGWFRTGDLGYLDSDGYLFITGRIVTVIVTESGENIQPNEVELAYQIHPMIREVGVLQQDGKLVALIVPELSEIRESHYLGLDMAIREAVQERSKRLPSYQRISDYVITRDSLARTRLGKLRRYILPNRYAAAKCSEKEAGKSAKGPISPEEMSSEDRALLDNLAAKQTWDWLTARYADQHVTPDTMPQLDLGIDSLEWVGLTLEIGRLTGVELSEEAIGGIETIRDLLQKVTEASEADQIPAMDLSLEHPESALSDQQKHWLKPLGPLMSAFAWLVLAVNRLLFMALFRLRVQGLQHVPDQGPYLLTPNHTSYLDAPALAAALGYKRLRRIFWAGATTVMFSNPFMRFGSRLFQTVPIDARGAAISSLALGAVVLTHNNNLVWFPEGQRSPTGKLRPFKPGLGVLLENFPVPVVPVLIRGTYQALPSSRLLPRFKPITIRFGAPLNVLDLKQRGKGENAHVRIVQALHEQISELDNRDKL